MSLIVIVGIVIGVAVLVVGGLFLYGACSASSNEYAPENMTEEERRKANWNMDEYRANQATHT